MKTHRKALILSVFCSLFLLICASAVADTNPEGFALLPAGTLGNIDREFIPEPEPEEVFQWNGETETGSEGTGEENPDRQGLESAQTTVSLTQTVVSELRRTWYISVSGAQTACRFDYVIVEPTWVNGELKNYAVAQSLNSQYYNYSHEFEYNGNYELWVYVKNTSGNTVAFGQFPFSVNVYGHDRLVLNLVGPETVTSIGSASTWTAYASGGTGGYTWCFELNEQQTNVMCDGYRKCTVTSTEKFVSYGVFSYQFVCNGEYELLVWLRDNGGHEVSARKVIQVNASGVPTIMQRASQLITQCRSEGNNTDYEIALWAHEWLIRNTDYDYGEPTHYGADRALMGRNIVCQGYAVAFCTLMQTAGIPCEYVRSGDMSHGWDVVKLGGKWYMVDCTWDDGSAGFGADTHRYCFITDEALRADHKNYECSRSCKSIVANYYVQEHISDTWLFALCDQVQETLQQGSYCFQVSLPANYTAENFTFSASSTVGITADLACKEYISYYNNIFSWHNIRVPLSLSINRSNRKLYAEVNFSGKTLILPASLKTIESGAFAGDAQIMAVIIPKGVTEIGAGAFGGCTNLWKVTIPASVTWIPDNAFDTNTGHLCIVAPKNSAGNTFATRHGLWFQELTE